MLLLNKFKEILGDETQSSTDKELEQIRDAQYQLAELIFEFWLKEKGK